MSVASKRTGIDTSAKAKRRHSDPILNLGKCKECGSSNPYSIGETMPKSCASCGSKMEGRVIERPTTAFNPLRVEKTEDGVKVSRMGEHKYQDIKALDRLDRACKHRTSQESGVGFLGDKAKQRVTHTTRTRNRRK